MSQQKQTVFNYNNEEVYDYHFYFKRRLPDAHKSSTFMNRSSSYKTLNHNQTKQVSHWYSFNNSRRSDDMINQIMNQRTILEDQENISEDCRPKRYAATLDGNKVNKKSNSNESLAEWMQLLGVIIITYILIVIIWIICVVSINSNFNATMASFMALFILFIIGIIIYWHCGYKQREAQIKAMINTKWQDSTIDLHSS